MSDFRLPWGSRYFYGCCHFVKSLVMKSTKISLFYITLSVLFSLHLYQIAEGKQNSWTTKLSTYIFLEENQHNILDGLLAFWKMVRVVQKTSKGIVAPLFRWLNVDDLVSSTKILWVEIIRNLTHIVWFPNYIWSRQGPSPTLAWVMVPPLL